jgi:hypothetical protein
MVKIALIIIGAAIVLIALVIAISLIAEHSFNRMVKNETAQILSTIHTNAYSIDPNEIKKLPHSVQTWLRRSGAVNSPRSMSVHLTQTGRMRTANEKPWMRFEAEQYFTIDKPAFICNARVSVAPLIFMVARDKYENGHGNMLIKLSSIIPIADSHGPEMDQGTMLRYLAEMTWFPSAALADYISWEGIDSLHARATMSYGGISASGVFAFTEEGDAIGFEAQRYGEFDGVFRLETWSITSRNHKSLNGIRIPTVSEVSWKLKRGEYRWLTLEITGIDYNVGLPGAD